MLTEKDRPSDALSSMGDVGGLIIITAAQTNDGKEESDTRQMKLNKDIHCDAVDLQ